MLWQTRTRLFDLAKRGVVMGILNATPDSFSDGGLYLDPDGHDLAHEIGAQLSGISDEVVRATRHLDIGDWRSIVFETEAASVAMAPTWNKGLLVVAASRTTPLGLLRRLLEQCAARAQRWLHDGVTQ